MLLLIVVWVIVPSDSHFGPSIRQHREKLKRLQEEEAAIRREKAAKGQPPKRASG
jgi:hypothetical protein